MMATFAAPGCMPREEYFALHGLDPNRKLLSYACSFVTFSPNYQNIAALAKLVNSGNLAEPAQLLIRLHPNHFMPGSLYENEANRVRELVRTLPHVHLVEPVPLGGELGYYSGEDMPEKASMMAYSDVFLTVYSTMVVETAIHDRPIVSVCIDAPDGWNTPGKFSLSLSEIGEWPTHQRFRQADAGRVAFNETQLLDACEPVPERPGQGWRGPAQIYPGRMHLHGRQRWKTHRRVGACAADQKNPGRGITMKFLIAGFGSIGRRHLRNLQALGERDILLYRSHHSTLPDEEIAGLPVETDLKAALAHHPDAVIISNPTALHLDVAIPAAQAGCAILLEKPIAAFAGAGG